MCSFQESTTEPLLVKVNWDCLAAGITLRKHSTFPCTDLRSPLGRFMAGAQSAGPVFVVSVIWSCALPDTHPLLMQT